MFLFVARIISLPASVFCANSAIFAFRLRGPEGEFIHNWFSPIALWEISMASGLRQNEDTLWRPRCALVTILLVRGKTRQNCCAPRGYKKRHFCMPITNIAGAAKPVTMWETCSRQHCVVVALPPHVSSFCLGLALQEILDGTTGFGKLAQKTVWVLRLDDKSVSR